ncbi:hypothetical protein BWI75_18725 [Gloeocapsopsis sp. AAB1 = 1H9]|uniref:Uncharacterized protein n=1 Tax=Gloeocapsopsis dulcis AAB1 = 1H9 TaxID=1433147 RepID=A0A6N8FZY5_9CHRO|nr:hypothetical protein [Gloeocapsopsis dulcis AAB1 = 1H9]
MFLLAFSPVSLASDRQLIEAKVCQAGKPKCVELVIRKMQQRYQPLAKQCDHDALFALAYLRTTQTFLKTIDEINYNNPATVVREDALFADYYFRAYDAYHTGKGYVPPAWQIAFDAAQRRSVSGSGNLILGFNAHIQRDLPFVLYELYLRGRPVSYKDHIRVNEFLQQVNILPELARKFDPTIDEDTPGDADDLQRFQLIAQWREGAYRNFERLRDASTNTQRIKIAAEIEAQTAATAFILRQAFSYPPGIDSSERDAYCQAQRKQK